MGVSHKSVEEQLYQRYVKFFKKLRTSKSDKIQLLVNIVARDIRSTTGKNLDHIFRLTGLDPWDVNEETIEMSLVRNPVPEEEMWRLPLLSQYLKQRREMEVNMENTDAISDLIQSLCVT